MGILNVTPDSFADHGAHFDPAVALAHARELVAAGADILDVGGESTRPYAEPVPLAEELRRACRSSPPWPRSSPSPSPSTPTRPRWPGRRFGRRRHYR